MRLPRVPERFVLTANDSDEDPPAEVEVRNARGERLARYSLCEVVGTCGKGAETSPGIAVDDVPVTLEVQEEELPERFTLGLVNAGPCDRHGWDCPHWMRSAVYVRN